MELLKEHSAEVLASADVIKGSIVDESIGLLDTKTLEIHYYLSDGSHAIDAKAFYACQQELVGLIEFVAKQLDVQVDIKTIATKREGGVIDYLMIGSKAIALVPYTKILIFCTTYIVGKIMTPGLAEGFKTIVNHWVNELLKTEREKSEEQLEHEVKKMRLEKEKADLEKRRNVHFNERIEKAFEKRRSQFYRQAKSVATVEKIGFEVKDSPLSKSYIWKEEVPRAKFSDYLNESNEIEPFEDPNAEIEIVAPVLKQGRRKWKGIYMEKDISFAVSDNAFLKAVWERKFMFSNGSVIRCHLEVSQEVDADGDVKSTSYNVLEVFDMSVNGTPQQMPHRTRMKKKEALSVEPTLFSEDMFDD